MPVNLCLIHDSLYLTRNCTLSRIFSINNTLWTPILVVSIFEMCRTRGLMKKQETEVINDKFITLVQPRVLLCSDPWLLSQSTGTNCCMFWLKQDLRNYVRSSRTWLTHRTRSKFSDAPLSVLSQQQNPSKSLTLHLPNGLETRKK